MQLQEPIQASKPYLQGNELWQDGQKRGYILNSTFITKRKREQHFFRKLQSYPISQATLRLLYYSGVEQIKILEEDNHKYRAYTCKIELYLNGDFVKEEHFEVQLSIPLTMLKEIEVTQLEILLS